PNKPQMLKAGVIWLIGTDGLGHNELASCVPSRPRQGRQLWNVLETTKSTSTTLQLALKTGQGQCAPLAEERICQLPSISIGDTSKAQAVEQFSGPSKLQMLKAGVFWLIGTDGSGHNELASCVPSRRSMPINQMTSVNA
ncbi:hypothetical protein TYRP_022172, partial [Tyrophagus putrescentiae]